MSKIEIYVNDQDAWFHSMPIIASGSIGTDKVKFTCNSAWSDATLHATFYRSGDRENQTSVALDENDEAVIPYEITKEAGRIYIGLIGTMVNGADVEKLTSMILPYKIVEGSKTSLPVG